MATKLIKALHNGDPETAKKLIQSGADIHAKDDLALRLAALYGHLELVKLLVELGSDIESNNGEALIWASIGRDQRHRDVVKFLIESGAKTRGERAYNGESYDSAWT